MKHSGQLSAWSALYRRLSPARQRALFITIALMLSGAIAELATIGSVIPFLSIAAHQNDKSNWAIAMLGRASASIGVAPIILAASVLIAIAIISAGIRVMLTWVSQRFVFSVGYDLGVDVYNRMLHQPYTYHVMRNTSHTVAALQKVQLVISGVMLPGMKAVTASVVAFFILAALFVIDPVTALLASVSLGTIYIVLGMSTRQRLRRNSVFITEAHTDRIQAVQEGLGGIRDVILDRSQPIFLAKFARIDSRLRRAGAINQFFATAPKAIVEGCAIILIAVISLVVDARPGGLVAALPMLGALALGAQRLLPQIQQMYSSWSQVVGNRAVLFDILDLLDRPAPVPAPVSETAPYTPFKTEIALDKVTFRYPTGDRPALHGIDLRIAKGERVGFIGKSGSGKSTMVDLLMGLLEPSEGTMRIDGQVLDAAGIAGWQKQIAHVPQAIFLADTTIAGNIAFGRDPETLDLARVKAAARAADVHEFVASLPDGYQTEIGERGVRLSGGQRQRLGIARALYKRATVLVLDEATSALDDHTERSVMESIDGLSDELTVITIAHRITTLKRCDRIVRIADGRVTDIAGYAEIVGDTTQPASRAR